MTKTRTIHFTRAALVAGTALAGLFATTPVAAQRLFAMLRQLDQAGYTIIHVELARGAGLAEALNDRLRRAAAK